MKTIITPSRLLLLLLIVISTKVSAQVEEAKNFPSARHIQIFENASFRIVYFDGTGVKTFRDVELFPSREVKQIAFNPAGSSIATIMKKDEVIIWSFNNVNERLFQLKDKRKGISVKPIPLSICYSEDARHFVLANSIGEIIVHDTRNYQQQFIVQGSEPATFIRMSPDNYFIAAVSGNSVDIWNFETKTIRKKLSHNAAFNDIAFSTDGSMMAATTADNKVIVWQTRNWEPLLTFDTKGTATSPSFNQDDKYLAFVQNANELAILNLRKKELTQVIVEPGYVSGSRFFDNKQTNESYIVSTRSNAIIFWNANGLNPFYGKLINREVDQKMNDWVKMMQDESLEDYAIRVNDETRAKQRELFTQEAATTMAGDRISIESPFTGDYNAENSLLAINFNSLPSIEIPVPEGELSSFGQDANLSFANAVYTLNENDEFEIAYIEVTNEVTNKVYIYDNIGRTRLEAIEVDFDFVPLDILQIANQEEINLKAISEEVVEENKQEQLITENTQIDVNTTVVADVDADGNKILNYQINYKYEVINKEFSAKEDFPSGGYDIQRSNAAMSLMKIIKNSFENGDFAKYLEEGKLVKIVITGAADAAPIRGKIAYDGRYGDFVDEPYYVDGNLDNITVTKASGITSNPQLALLRAAGVKDYISKNIETLKNTRNDYRFNVEVAKERGGEFRRINIQFVIVDAFKQP